MPETDARFEADLLRRYLLGRDVECPSCRYNLRDLTGERCPECGQAVALRLQMAEPKLAAMLTGLVALSAGAGFNALLTIYFAIDVYHQGYPMDYKFLVINLSGLVVEGAALAAWLGLWRRIRRIEPVWRWALVAGCAALTLCNIVVFSLNIR